MPENAATTVALSYLQDLAARNSNRRNSYTTYRQYYDGSIGHDLMERAKKFMNLPKDVEFNLNICDIPVDVIAERLKITGVTCDSDEQQVKLWNWWTANRMDGVQKNVYRDAFRDGDGYVLVSPPDESGIPQFTHEQAHDGDFGVEMVYGDDHKPLMAWRYWRVSTVGDAGYVRRKNYYLPDKIQKYISDERQNRGAWTEYKDENDSRWPIPWVDSKGQPLGIPVIHFANKCNVDYGVSELRKAIAVQNLLNKSVADLIMSADVDAYAILILLGFSKSDIEDLKIGPGAIIGNSNTDAKATRLEAADLTKMMALVDFFIVKMAQITRTPISYFQSSRQISSAESQKQDESPLISKVEDRQVPFGNAWEDVLRMGRKLYNTFGDGGMDEEIGIEAQWADAQKRNEKEQADIAKIHKDLGVPEKYVWAKLDYTPEQIDKMMESDEYQARQQSRQAMAQLGMMTANAPSEEEDAT